MKRIFASTLVFGACALSLFACQTQEPRSPDVGLTQPIHPPQPPDLGRGAARVETGTIYSLYLDDSLRNICAGPAPFFAFDSAKTSAKDQPTMQTLVNCMIDGPLRGKSIALIGRTDPRGSEEYNQQLGLERAEKVKRYLIANGIQEDRVKAYSLGKEDAHPSPKDWSGDRRVQVELVP